MAGNSVWKCSLGILENFKTSFPVVKARVNLFYYVLLEIAHYITHRVIVCVGKFDSLFFHTFTLTRLMSGQSSHMTRAHHGWPAEGRQTPIYVIES